MKIVIPNNLGQVAMTTSNIEILIHESLKLRNFKILKLVFELINLDQQKKKNIWFEITSP